MCVTTFQHADLLTYAYGSIIFHIGCSPHSVCLGPFLVMPFFGVHRLSFISHTAVQLYDIQLQPCVPETDKQTSDWLVLIP